LRAHRAKQAEERLALGPAYDCVRVQEDHPGRLTVGITLDTYSHVLPGMQEGAVRLLDAALAINEKKQSRQGMRGAHAGVAADCAPETQFG
jgi:hypothetical protein